MRYAVAIMTLVVSAVLLVLGVGQRTFLAGPSEITRPVEVDASAGYVVIPDEVFTAMPGRANVVIGGDSQFLATAKNRDVEGWVRPFDHATVSVEAAGGGFASTLVAGEEDAENPVEPLDPRGSDLWLEERSSPSGQTSGDNLRVPIAPMAGQSVIVAADGAAAPSEISVVWEQDRRTPWAGPLLAAGGVLAVLGLVLWLLAFDHDRRGLGPRRGRRGPLQGVRNVFGRRKLSGPGKKAGRGAKRGRGSAMVAARRPMRAAAIPALGLAAVLGLSACSPGYWPELSPQPTEQQPAPDLEEDEDMAPVPVTEKQLDRIVARVAEAAQAGDEALDASLIEQRFTGDAFDQRASNYQIRAAVEDYPVIPPHITDEALDYELVQSTEGWPRTIFVTVASSRDEVEEGAEAEASTEEEGVEADASVDAAEEEADGQSSSPSLALIMTQQSPHENYLVSRVVQLRGGIEMPPAAPAEEGTARLADDLQTLVLPPGELGAAYAAVLQNGASDPQAELFDLEGDSLVENFGGAAVAKLTQLAEDEGNGDRVTYSASVAQNDRPIVSLSTGIGGALVAVTLVEEQVAQAEGDWRLRFEEDRAASALSGIEGQRERQVRQFSHQVLFFVPGKNSDAPIQRLGSTTQLIGAGE